MPPTRKPRPPEPPPLRTARTTYTQTLLAGAERYYSTFLPPTGGNQKLLRVWDFAGCEPTKGLPGRRSRPGTCPVLHVVTGDLRAVLGKRECDTAANVGSDTGD